MAYRTHVVTNKEQANPYSGSSLVPMLVIGLLLTFAGMIAALLFLFLPKTSSLAAHSVASLCVLIGVFAFRLNFVIPQLAMDEFSIAEGWHASMPHLQEWQLVVFGAVITGMALLVGRRLLPVFTSSSAIDFELAARAPWRPWTGLLQHQEEWR